MSQAKTSKIVIDYEMMVEEEAHILSMIAASESNIQEVKTQVPVRRRQPKAVVAALESKRSNELAEYKELEDHEKKVYNARVDCLGGGSINDLELAEGMLSAIRESRKDKAEDEAKTLSLFNGHYPTNKRRSSNYFRQDHIHRVALLRLGATWAPSKGMWMWYGLKSEFLIIFRLYL